MYVVHRVVKILEQYSNQIQSVVQGTTNPDLCCHLANDTDLLMPVIWATAGDNKKLTRLPELTQNVIRSSHGHSKPSLKISCKSVQSFSCNVADKETKKSPENNTTSPTGGGVMKTGSVETVLTSNF